MTKKLTVIFSLGAILIAVVTLFVLSPKDNTELQEVNVEESNPVGVNPDEIIREINKSPEQEAINNYRGQNFEDAISSSRAIANDTSKDAGIRFQQYEICILSAVKISNFEVADECLNAGLELSKEVDLTNDVDWPAALREARE